MRRADRLFRIVQILQSRRVVTARQLAEELEVSERTIYRDMADLSASGVPVAAEAGVGYMLLAGFELPPLVFDLREITALVLGARMLQGRTDPELADAARSALGKIEAVLPERLRSRIHETPIFSPDFGLGDHPGESFRTLRTAIDARRKIAVAYEDREGRASERVLSPLGLYFWGRNWTLAAWCELRRDYRNFRLDRLERIDLLESPIPDDPAVSLDGFLAAMLERD